LTSPPTPLLALTDLHVTLATAQGAVQAVRGLSLQLQRGHTLGLVGASGCGKSLTALAVMGLLPEGAVVGGSVRLGDTELTTLAEGAWCALRGRRIGMVFQEPMSALNPLHTIGHQVAEPLRLHGGLSAAAARAQALRLLDRVQVPRAAQRLAAYPHQLSGGQRQRVLIAMALACGPELLIADEPTTALDTTLQRDVLALIQQLVREDGMGLLLISHDLGVMADSVQDLLVMHAGVAVEHGPTAQLLARPAHPHTRALMAARPRLRSGTGQPHRRQGPAGTDHRATAPLLAVENLARRYPLPRQGWFTPAPALQALAGVSFTLQAGRSLGVVGASGSGKSTLARLVMALEAPSAGSVKLQGQDLQRLNAADLRAARRQFQMVFQDPYGSLDPRRTVLQTVAEPLAVLQGATPAEQRERAAEVLDAVGLRAADGARYPHEFSGGQRQRIAIARALVTRPALIVADEAVSALDASVQAQVLDLMQDLQQRYGMAYLFISHDLAVVDRLCDEVLVLQQGRIVEQGPPERLFSAPQHACTRALLAAVPGRDNRPAPGLRGE
jgi:peptide/nickel transport system ATP-binding protein